MKAGADQGTSSEFVKSEHPQTGNASGSEQRAATHTLGNFCVVLRLGNGLGSEGSRGWTMGGGATLRTPASTSTVQRADGSEGGRSIVKGGRSKRDTKKLML